MRYVCVVCRALRGALDILKRLNNLLATDILRESVHVTLPLQHCNIQESRERQINTFVASYTIRGLLYKRIVWLIAETWYPAVEIALQFDQGDGSDVINAARICCYNNTHIWPLFESPQKHGAALRQRQLDSGASRLRHPQRQVTR